MAVHLGYRSGISVSVTPSSPVDPLAGFNWAARLQTHIPGSNTPIGLYQDVACTIPATQDFDPVAAIRGEFSTGNITLTQSDDIKQGFLFGTEVILDGVDDFYVGDAIPNAGTSSISLYLLMSGDAAGPNKELGMVAIDDGTTSGFQVGFWLERVTYSPTNITNYNSNLFFVSADNSVPNSGFTSQVFALIKQFGVRSDVYVDGSISGLGSTNATITGAFTNNQIYLGRTDKYYSGGFSALLMALDQTIPFSTVNDYLNSLK